MVPIEDPFLSKNEESDITSQTLCINYHIDFDLIDQLKHICVKIPLLQAIKDIPIYGKAIKEACLKKPGCKKNDPQTIYVIGQLATIMLGKVTVPKYSDLGSHIVKLVIN